MLNIFNIYLYIYCRKSLFDEYVEETEYTPLPAEQRPGGFNWGEDERPNAENTADNDENAENQQANNNQ